MADVLQSVQPFVKLAAEGLVNSLWQGILLSVLTWLVLRIMPSPAATRYAAWYLTLCAIVGLPFLHIAGGFWTPDRPVPPPAVPVGFPPAPEALSSPAMSVHLPVEIGKDTAATLLFLAWLAAAAFLAARLAAGYRGLLRIKSRSQPATGLDAARWLHWRALHPSARDPELRIARCIGLPITAGFIRPAILFPEKLLANLTGQEAHGIWLHELAHVRRWDDWTKLGQKFAEAVLFFHPAVRCIGKQLGLDREIACDDWVVAQTGAARPYAACLARMAELTSSAGTVPAPAMATDRKQIFRRMEMLIQKNREHNQSKASGLAAVVLILATVFFVALAGPVFVFASPQAPVASASAQRPAPPPEPAPAALPAPPAPGEQKAAPPAPPAPSPEPRPAVRVAELQSEMEPLRAEMDRLREEIHGDVQESIQAHAEEIRKLAHEIQDKVHAEIQPHVQEIGRLSREIETEARTQQPDENKIRQLEKQIDEIEQSSIRKAEEQIRALEDKIRSYEAKIRPAEESIRKLEEKMREVEARIEAKAEEFEKQLKERQKPESRAPREN